MGNIFSIPFSQQKSLRNLAVVMGMLLAMLCSGRAVAQTLEWAKQAGGTDFDRTTQCHVHYELSTQVPSITS